MRSLLIVKKIVIVVMIIYNNKFYGSCLLSCCTFIKSIFCIISPCCHSEKEGEDVNNLCEDGSYNHNFYEDVSFCSCEPSCKSYGVRYKYLVCLNCDKKFVEGEKGLKIFIKDDELFIPKKPHKLEYHKEFIPKCDSERNGNKAFYECRKCFTKYKTEECNDYYTEFGEDSYIIEKPKHDYEEKQVGEDNHFICKCKACGHEYEYTVD